MDAAKLLAGNTIIPVLVIEEAGVAVDLVLALRDAGIKAVEVTLRTDGALSAIEAIATEVEDMIVGAGSVREAGHFSAAKHAGAQFVVSPGTTVTLLKTAEITGIPFVPGAVTPSEILLLLEKGYSLQKFFPAEQSGGVAMLKAMSAPLPEVKFFPTGGINEKVAPDYLQLACVDCIGGSWFIDNELLEAKKFSEICRQAKEALNGCNG